MCNAWNLKMAKNNFSKERQRTIGAYFWPPNHYILRVLGCQEIEQKKQSNEINSSPYFCNLWISLGNLLKIMFLEVQK